MLEMRAIQGNTATDASFVACLLAKQFLEAQFGTIPFDAAAKSQNAPGLDIEFEASNGELVAAEIKTTVPCSRAKGDLGSNQKNSFKSDFDKLNGSSARHKFYFVTDRLSYSLLKGKYAQHIPGVEVHLLGSDDPA